MGRTGARPALRLIALLVSFTVLLVAVGGKLVYLQVFRAQPLELLGAKQRLRTLELPARRGEIFDRAMLPLAMSVESRAIYANPRMMSHPGTAATALAPLLGMDREAVLAKLTNRTTGFVYLARGVPVALAKQVASLGIETIGTLRESSREYPADTLAGQVLGFVGTDGDGLSGLESRYNSVLRGKPGQAVFERDPNGRTIPQGHNSLVEPVPGQGLSLTIDRDVQYYAESALARGAASTRARSGVAVVLDVRTGDVLAMANWPPMNPNAFAKATPEQQRNRVVTDAYEPGSVNKIVTAAASIEAGLMTPSDHVIVPYHYRVADKTFSDFAPHGTLNISYAEVLARSSNIGTIKVALKLGPARLYAALRNFGLGSPPGTGFPGESAGILRPLDSWSATDIGTIPIGQGIAMTPMQIASMYGTLANDGVRIVPRLVRGTVGPDGKLVPAPREAPRRVVSAFTAAQVRSMLVGVVEGGTGSRAKIGGYLVGGKTGTARVPKPNGLGYSNRAITTFAGLAPANDPRFVVVTSLENPAIHFSALTAAPVFREIMAFTLGMFGVAPSVAAPTAAAGGVPLDRVRARRP